MHATFVHVRVKPEHAQAFIEATRANHEASIKEPGNLRFDVLRSPDEPERFLIYEVYRDAASATAHKQTAHYLAWRERVADWMAEPRTGVPWEAIAVGPGA